MTNLLGCVKSVSKRAGNSAWKGISVVFWPWLINYTSFKHVINKEGTDANVNERVRSWCESKAAELSNVGVSGGLTSAVVTGAFTWKQGNDSVPPLSRACWYSALVLALTAITLATQQNISLSRAKVNPRGWAYLRHILNVNGDDLGSDQQDPSFVQLYIWQVPVMLLNFSNMLLALGILALVFHTEDQNVMIAVGAAAAFAGINYLGSTLTLYQNALYADKHE